MAYEDIKTENDPSPEHIPSREEILSQFRNYCESFEIERELSDAEGVYLLEVLSPDGTKRYAYQREKGFGEHIGSTGTTIRSEDTDDGYSRTLADYDAATGEWKKQ